MRFLECKFSNFHTYLIIFFAGPIDNTFSLVQVKTGRRTGYKPLSEQVMAEYNDAYMLNEFNWICNISYYLRTGPINGMKEFDANVKI